MFRLDLLLARDQGDGFRSDLGDDAVIDLARQQAQRQADHARLVAQHALDGEMGLAGIGRAEHGQHVPRDVPRGPIPRLSRIGPGEKSSLIDVMAARLPAGLRHCPDPGR